MRKLGFVLLLAACGPGGMMAGTDASTMDVQTTADSATANDAAAAGEGGGMCTFNADCIASERCECSETTGCFCRPGMRGRGRAGVDPCTTGNDCETALCIEGNSGFFCSGPCMSDAQCMGALPICSQIALVGQVCIRRPM